ncbi:unnamed protein product [Strongylus vulgaris]|uniref:Uncharacterized protein n=1 Tax=Strongylus vulgaris TaxID=40348 RepID=A0A3P7LGI4_STRVU|nr:unnamed protein product [Strongylus vulgaris]
MPLRGFDDDLTLQCHGRLVVPMVKATIGLQRASIEEEIGFVGLVRHVWWAEKWVERSRLRFYDEDNSKRLVTECSLRRCP